MKTTCIALMLVLTVAFVPADEQWQFPQTKTAWNSMTAEQIQQILASGADVNARDVDGWTALTWAVYSKADLEVISLLISAGADADAWIGGGTVLMVAIDCYQDL